MDINTIIELYIRNMVSSKKSSHTIGAYTRNIKEFIQRKNIQDTEQFKVITLPDLYDYIDELHKEYSPSTVNQKIATLKTFYKFLMKLDIINTNPTKAIDEVHVGERIYTVLEEEETQKLLNISDTIYENNIFLSVRNKLIVKIFLENGVRAFELENMQLSKLNLKKQRVLIVGKWNIERFVYFSDEVIELLQQYLQLRNLIKVKEEHQDYIFITEKGTWLRKRMIQYTIKKYVEEANITSVSTHALRHTCASTFYAKGRSMKDIQTLLGHKRLTTTEQYIHSLSLQKSNA